MVTIFNKTFSS